MNQPHIPSLDYPVHTIFCIGRNYELHAKEMGQPSPSEPMVFLKPSNSICYNNAVIQIPPQSKNVHHEVELVIAIGQSGKDIPKEKASSYIAGYGIGIDFTARDIQKKAKEKGHPWSVAKGFDGFAPISDFVPLEYGTTIPDMALTLNVNGIPRQKGNSADMIFDVATLISYISSIFTLNKGDLIFTGTPMGVSKIESGDVVEAILGDEIVTLRISIA